jgi:Adenylate cyclase regulatory domain
MTGGIDFEAEGLLDDLSGQAREARLALLPELAEAGVPLDELKRAVEEDRLVLLPVERPGDLGLRVHARVAAGHCAPVRFTWRQLTEIPTEVAAALRRRLGAKQEMPDARRLHRK